LTPPWNAITVDVGFEVLRRRAMNDQTGPGKYDLVLSIRSFNVMKHVGATTVGELVLYTEEEILESRCFGETSLNEIRAALAKRGLRLGMLPAQLRGRVGLDGKIVKQQPEANPPVTNQPAEEQAHDRDESSCCGHCEQAAKKLRERAAKRRAGEASN
jgi:hypothetical protein